MKPPSIHVPWLDKLRQVGLTALGKAVVALMLTASSTVFIPSECSWFSQFAHKMDLPMSAWDSTQLRCPYCPFCILKEEVFSRLFGNLWPELHCLCIHFAFESVNSWGGEGRESYWSHCCAWQKFKMWSKFSSNSHAAVCPPALGTAWKWTPASTTKHLCSWLESIWEEHSCWNTHHQLP